MHMQFIYTQNQFLPADVPFITADDRSFRFGDGIFETMLVVDGRMYHWNAHIARITRGLGFFRLALDISQLEKNCKALIEKNNCRSGYVRVVISRGNDAGAMGYLMGKNAVPYYVIQTIEKPFPPYRALNLYVSSTPAHMSVPCKTNSAVHYTLSMLEAQEHGCENALILDTHGHICETASGNIFWVKNGTLYTPEMGLAFVPGTIRARLISLSPLPVKEGRFTLADLANADEIFMTNIGGLVTKIVSVMPLGYVAKGDALTQQFRTLIEADIR